MLKKILFYRISRTVSNFSTYEKIDTERRESKERCVK